MKNILLYKVHMPPSEELMPELEKVLYSGMITEGIKVKQFEEEFQKKFNLNYRPLSVNSGTSALQLAYRLCDVKDRIVLTTPMTCFANVCAILNEGGKIVWCDIDPNTGNISADDVKKKIELYDERKIACVSFVDLAGFPADLDKLDEVCDWISLVEDAAQSLGAKWDGRWIGQGYRKYAKYDCEPGDHYVCYSFQAIKHLTTVDGGMLAVNGPWAEYNSLEKGKKLKWFGIDREAAKEETRWNYDIEKHGSKWHMNNVNATIGIAQLNRLDAVLETHKQNGQYYNEALKNVSGVQLMTVPKKSEPSYWI
ncbi:MAG: DegT/DnrJ/EryC1/StrS family aminotransferase, partial [Nanoarchaeota archaeon]